MAVQLLGSLLTEKPQKERSKATANLLSHLNQLMVKVISTLMDS